jgi:hypothetical protein
MGHELTFTYDVGRMLDQCREHIESPAADLDWDAVFLENSLNRAQPKGPELDYAVKRRLSCGCLGTGSEQFPPTFDSQLHARRVKSRCIVWDARKV